MNLMRAKWQAIIVSCVLLAGCDSDQATIWSAIAASPNGVLIASAHTTQISGPGTAFVGTTVSLGVAKDTKPLVILGFANESAYPAGVTAVKLHWLSNTELDVTYNSGATISFQAIKAYGVAITAHQKASP
jgi:hypothetical protein